MALSAAAQPLGLRGRVTTASGEAIPGASVRLKGLSIGTATGTDGHFALDVPAAGNYTVQITAVGFVPYMQPVTVPLSEALQVILHESTRQLEQVTVYSLREYPVTQTKVSAEDLSKLNVAQDMPILLNFTPSMVTTSDAGAGVGYTGMRIRGSDASRINVTVNGIPLNDAESHGVFWVNMPDLASSVQGITIQRGVGSSVNGAGAFGASVHLETNRPSEKAFARLSNSYGSFNTWRHNVEVNTGRLPNRMAFYGRLSKISSDGFIDKASADLRSFFLSANYLTKRGTLTANIFSGKEVTFQAWNGVPEERLRAGERTYNELARYDNEVDNYQQDHYQLIWNEQLNPRWRTNLALHYTRGRGYFEQYREGDALSRYGLQPLVIGGQTISETDLIRRRWLDNHFFGGVWSADYQSAQTRGNGPALTATVGGGWNRYEGKHFGEVIWARFMSNGNIRHRYYDNDAIKTDFNAYAKANWQFSQGWYLYGDMQMRKVGYTFLGLAADAQSNIFNATQTDNLLFFNPKGGLRYEKDRHHAYASYAVANREPNRDDYTQSSVRSRPAHETLHNIEIGYGYTLPKVAFQVNYYRMNYLNQLIVTGQINDVGAYTRQNVPDSYRTGLEAQVRVQPAKWITWEANLTLSRNRIGRFVEYTDQFDAAWNPLPQIQTVHEQTDIALSPNVIGASQLIFKPKKGLECGLLTKHVGRQFLDNTSNSQRAIAAYWVTDLRINYEFGTKLFPKIGINLLVNNMFDRLYESNGYTFGWVQNGTPTRSNYYYPQAGTNFLVGVTLGIE